MIEILKVVEMQNLLKIEGPRYVHAGAGHLTKNCPSGWDMTN